MVSSKIYGIILLLALYNFNSFSNTFIGFFNNSLIGYFIPNCDFNKANIINKKIFLNKMHINICTSKYNYPYNYYCNKDLINNNGWDQNVINQKLKNDIFFL